MMPIYEFYCSACDTVYNFFSRSVNTDKIPFCPHCKTRRLRRQMSLFANISGGREDSEGDQESMPAFDEAKMEKAFAMLSSEAEKMDENDPRQAAQLMRKLSDAAGIGMGEGMEEALRRMERGEDPEQIEAELGDLLNEEEPFLLDGKSGKRLRKETTPRVDETLYDL